MLIQTYGEKYQTAASAATATAPADTAVGSTAAEILEMVSCYAYDGMVFYRKGDLVNASASFAYGYGWLDAGCMLGFLNGTTSTGPSEITEKIPEALHEHLAEKTRRYKRMLTEAAGCVVILPDTETPMYRAAVKVQAIVTAEFNRANDIFSTGDEMNALAHFSYGYGWLDCGVRSGLFGITGDRHLFTI
ncbi:DUF357 domain-containing protein [Methanorbis rubei]|uniref:DUF357 domain-containing protein n=1 Tax=Methanorbis rubei TaxID=3028300 RepID=A0AAE4MHH1_9EURY|nr:hypothetical protein [Methanocorpusculaceae archaeon Cs1]